MRPLLEDRGRITESIRILVPVDRMKQKCFQITTKRVGRSQQFQLRRQPVPCSPCGRQFVDVSAARRGCHNGRILTTNGHLAERNLSHPSPSVVSICAALSIRLGGWRAAWHLFAVRSNADRPAEPHNRQFVADLSAAAAARRRLIHVLVGRWRWRRGRRRSLQATPSATANHRGRRRRNPIMALFHRRPHSRRHFHIGRARIANIPIRR